MVVVSVAELFAGVGSVEPPGRATEAVFESVPVAVDTTVALTVNMTEPAASTLIEVEMLPDPEAGQLDPAEAAQVHVTPDSVAGIVSVTMAPVIADGPAFEAAMVYVSAVPALIVVKPSVLEIDRSAVGVSESVSVAELSAELVSTTPAGAAMLTVLAREPVAVDDTATITVYVTEPLGDKVAVVDIGSVPLAAPHVPPLPAAHVHVPDVAPLGKASVIGAAVAVEGPAFDATIVYVTLVPGTAVAAPSVLVTPRFTRGSAGVADVAVLLAGVSSGIVPGPATVAVLESVPVNVDASVAVMV